MGRIRTAPWREGPGGIGGSAALSVLRNRVSPTLRCPVGAAVGAIREHATGFFGSGGVLSPFTFHLMYTHYLALRHNLARWEIKS